LRLNIYAQQYKKYIIAVANCRISWLTALSVGYGFNQAKNKIKDLMLVEFIGGTIFWEWII